MNDIGFDRFYIKLIEEYPCENYTQLLAREGHYIREMGTLNKKIEGRTRQQYYEEHKTELADRRKQHYENNKDEILEQNKQYYENCKEEIAEQQKQYYKDNKEMIAERKGRIFECPCGSKCRWGNKAQHFKTKKHLAFVAQQNK
jgi:glucosamine 6-phosphate synthetase-like amidotransferase/phosphosugar isomerase protein